MLQAGSVLDGRIRVDEVHGDPARPEGLGTVLEGGARVRVIALAADEAKALAAASAVGHSYLAKFRELLTTEGVTYAIVEHVPGTTLQARLAELGKKPAVDAVRSALRIADAVTALHEAGGAHASLSAACVFVEAPQHDVPMVTWSALTPETALRSPERVAGAGPSEADDTWAVTALLYLMLTGAPPPAAGLRSLDELSDTGITDDALRAALVHGLHADHAVRSHDLVPLKRELARWFVDHASDEPHSGMRPTQPPPLPPSQMPAPRASIAVQHTSLGGVATSPAPAKARARMPVIAGGAIALGLVAAWIWSATRGPRVVEVKKAIPAAAAPEKSQAIDLGEVPVSASGTPSPGNETALCVAAYLPKSAFQGTPDLGWLCGESDAREGAAKLHGVIAKGGGPDAGTDAAKLFDKLGWYELAAYSVLRSGCCMDAKLTLPAPSASCGKMDEALMAIGREAAAGKSIDEPLASFGKAIACEVAAGKAGQFKRSGKPADGEEAAFREFVAQTQRR